MTNKSFVSLEIYNLHNNNNNIYTIINFTIMETISWLKVLYTINYDLVKLMGLEFIEKY